MSTVRERLDEWLHTHGQRLKALTRDQVLTYSSRILTGSFIFGAAANLATIPWSRTPMDNVGIAVLFAVLIVNQKAVESWRKTSMIWRKVAQGWQESSDMWRKLAEQQLEHQQQMFKQQMERWRN
jgi:hypothetical protein